jgi:hypothetical protein
MSHNISKENGKYRAVFAGARKDTWHSVGDYTDTDSIEPEVARKIVGIPVEIQTVTYQRPIGNGDAVETVSGKARLTVRQDTGAELAMVGPGYCVTPFAETLVDNLLPVVDAGLGTFDVAGLLDGGLRGWVMLKWNMEQISGRARDTFQREDLKPYTMFMAAHGEGIANVARNTYIRGVCSNTVGMILSQAASGFTLSHRKNVNQRQLEATRKLFKNLVGEFENTAAAFTLLRQTRLNKAMWDELVQKVALPEPTKEEMDGPRGHIVLERWQEKKTRILSLWQNGTGHVGDRSAWEAYNGLVESLDHDTDIWKARSEENRAVSLMSGPLAKIRNSVFASLLAHAHKVNGKVAVTA